MKVFYHLVGLLIVGLVVVPSALADISLKLKQTQYKAANDQQQFEESKYGNSKYHVFEVHNGFEPAVGRTSDNSGATSKVAVSNNDNVPAQTEEIRIEHINAPPGFPLDDPNLDATLLNVAAEDGDFQESAGRQETTSTTTTTTKVSTNNHNFPVPFPSNYRHEIPQKPTPKAVEYIEVQDDFRPSRPIQDFASTTQYQVQQQEVQTIGPLGAPAQQTFENSQGRNIGGRPFKGSDYLPPYQTSGPQAKPFKGNQFLPPVPGSNGDSNPFKGPDYLPPHSSGSGQLSQESFSTIQPFKGSDYLPPRQSGSAQLSPSNNPFKAPDYLPPHQSGSAQNSFELNNAFKGPDYLPPQTGRSAQDSFRPNNPFKGPGYLPPHVNAPRQQAAIVIPRFLPSGYDTPKPTNSEAAIAELHTLPEQSQDQQHRQEVTVQSQIQVSGGAQQSSDIVYGPSQQGNGAQAPEYFPSTYDVHSQQLANSKHNQEEGPNGYLPPNYDSQRPTSSGQYQQTAGEEGKSYSTSGYLPPGYDFQNPAVSDQAQNYQQSSAPVTESYEQQQNYEQTYQGQEQNFAQDTFQNSGQAQQAGQIFKAPDYLPPATQGQAQQAGQIFKAPDYLPPATQGQAQQGGQIFKAPDYLPPTTQGQVHQAGQIFKAPDYLPPTPQGQAQQAGQIFRAPDYLPPFQQQSSYQSATPAPAQPQASHMYPLSSYMASVQPYERYGSARKPFPEYGPPPTFQNNDVAPMYKEAANRPQYYAPAMSYAHNAVSTEAYNAYTQQRSSVAAPTLNQQTRQALQTFMPKEIRQDIAPVRSNGANTATGQVQTSTPASAKIRTVQIVNPNTVKTLKVLESLDHAGVKTIQILGPTNEEPMGEHRVVKVVSGHEKTVQTVKIFNDQQDATPGSNDYLPPRRKRNSKKSSPKGRRRIVGN